MQDSKDVLWLVGWSLASLFGTNTAISETRYVLWFEHWKVDHVKVPPTLWLPNATTPVHNCPVTAAGSDIFVCCWVDNTYIVPNVSVCYSLRWLTHVLNTRYRCRTDSNELSDTVRRHYFTYGSSAAVICNSSELHRTVFLQFQLYVKNRSVMNFVLEKN